MVNQVRVWGMANITLTCARTPFNTLSRLPLEQRRITSRTFPSGASVHTPMTVTMFGWGLSRSCPYRRISASRTLPSPLPTPNPLAFTATGEAFHTRSSTTPKAPSPNFRTKRRLT